MKGTGKAREIQGRYSGLDIHKEYVLAGGQNVVQEWVMQPRWISKEHIEKRITKSGRKELRWALVEAAWRAIRIILNNNKICHESQISIGRICFGFFKIKSKKICQH